MSRVSLSLDLPVSAQRVWDTIGGFNNLAKWHSRFYSSSGGGSKLHRWPGPRMNLRV